VERGLEGAYHFEVDNAFGGKRMVQEARTDALKAKKAEIETILFEEERRPFPDFAMVQQLKKQKLMVKDELQRALQH
jgi:hypothetical protein